MKAFLGFATAGLLAAVAAVAQVPPEITEANNRFESAVNRGDTAAIAALYTEDATLLPPQHAIISGRAGAGAFWRMAYEGGLRNMTLAPQSFTTWGEIGQEIGQFAAEQHNAGGAIERLEGKYVVIWKRTPEGWRLHTDIWNANR